METSNSEKGLARIQKWYADRKAWREANPEASRALDAAIERGNRRDLVPPDDLLRLGVPRPVVKALHAEKFTPAMDGAKNWWDSGKTFLLFLGGVGSGKTTAAAWCLWRELIEEEGTSRPSGGVVVDPAMFATAPEFNGLSDYSGSMREWLERLLRCRVLVLDDLGAERMGDGELSCVQRLISERHATNRRTVITSNLDAERFKARYGERVVDRIRESGVVKASGQESLRKAVT